MVNLVKFLLNFSTCSNCDFALPFIPGLKKTRSNSLQIYLQTGPLFVFQWLYDSAQLVWSIGAHIMRPGQLSNEESARVSYIGNEVRNSFNRTKGLSW